MSHQTWFEVCFFRTLILIPTNSPQGPQEAFEENETECDNDREWNRKLLNEWEDENWETCWQYNGDVWPVLDCALL